MVQRKNTFAGALRILVSAAVFLCVLAGAPVFSSAGDRITSFDSVAEIRRDSSVVLTESISFLIDGTSVKHGINRDFPLYREDGGGKKHRVGFTVERVTLDGKEEPFEVSMSGGNARVRIGDAAKLVPHGEHTYVIRYVTDRQMIFHDDFDEFYWNVTGDKWQFPIDYASYEVRLPSGAIDRFAAYTGRLGSREGAVKRVSGNRWVSVRPFEPGEGMTVSVAFAKDIVRQPLPGIGERIARFLAKYRAYCYGLLVLLCAIWYVCSWFKVGKDPEEETAVPLFHPPAGMSPGYMRYIRDLEFSQRGFTGDIIQMAVAGALRIDEHEEGTFIKSKRVTLTRLAGDGKRLPAPLGAMLEDLFSEGTSLRLSERSSGGILQKARRAANAEYGRGSGGLYSSNSGYSTAGLLFLLLCVVVMALASDTGESFAEVFILLAFGSVFAFVGALLLKQVVGKDMPVAGRLLSLIVGLSFGFGGVSLLSLYAPGDMAGISALFVLIVFFMTARAFMPAPSRRWQELKAQVRGLTMYMETAETDRLNMLNPPDRTPGHFEELLPYAYALDCMDAWAASFGNALASAEYVPEWYKGDAPHACFSSHTFDSLNEQALHGMHAYSAAEVASSAGSGVFGGGHSGGGGGGGGGSGW